MSKSNNKKSRKTRSDKFPFTLHKTGQYCKNIRDKTCYFGTDKQAAYQKYIEQASFLHINQGPLNHKERFINLSEFMALP